MNYKTGFLILCGIIISLFTFSIILINENNYYKEYASILCEGFNMELDFIKQIYPEVAEKRCQDIKILIDNSTKADVLCDQIKGIQWPEQIDCGSLR